MSVARNGKPRLDDEHPVIKFIKEFPDAPHKVVAFYTGRTPRAVRNIRYLMKLPKQPRPKRIG